MFLGEKQMTKNIAKKKSIMAIFLFMSFFTKGYALFECVSSGPTADCKTPQDAVNKCMKTSYSALLDAVRNDFRNGKDAVFPNFLMGNNLYLSKVTYNGVTYEIKDPKCLQSISGKSFADFADAADKAAYTAAKNAVQQAALTAQQNVQAQQKMLANQKEKAALIQACTSQCTTHESAFNQCLSKKYPSVYGDLKTRFVKGIDVSVPLDSADFLSMIGNTNQAQNCLNMMNQVVKAMPYYAEAAEGKGAYTVALTPISNVFNGLFSDDEINARKAARKNALDAERAAQQAALAQKSVNVQVACTYSAVNTLGAYSKCLATKHPDVYAGMKRAFVNGQKIELKQKLGAVISQGSEKGLDPNYNPALGDNYVIDINKIELFVDGKTDLPPVLKDGDFEVYTTPAKKGFFLISTVYSDAMASLDLDNFNLYMGIIDEDQAVVSALTPDQIQEIAQKFKGVFSDEEIIQRKSALGLSH
ncbi:MAG: hypothetical protein NEHIOOID_00281 [Holosporales bacterium]